MVRPYLKIFYHSNEAFKKFIATFYLTERNGVACRIYVFNTATYNAIKEQLTKPFIGLRM